jgi:hypothetical protein
MRVVDRETFLSLPAGTVFAKFGPPGGLDPKVPDWSLSDVAIKWDTCGEDFLVQDLTAQFEGWTGSESHFEQMGRMVADPSYEAPPLDYDSAGRDGLFDREQMFAVWSVRDTENLIACLQSALEAVRDNA